MNPHTSGSASVHPQQHLAARMASDLNPSRLTGPGVLDRYSADAITQRNGEGRARNSCHRCGATAYKSLMTRDEAGVMRHSGQYQCVQCRQVFSNVHQWRDGDAQ